MKAKDQFRPVRGTKDLMFDDILRHRHVEATAFEVAGRYGFIEISTPIIESLPVFQNTLGDTTDVVNKEMYVFQDRRGEELVLRPENTASIMRALLARGIQYLGGGTGALKFFYRGPMFRYERPQKGRYRQFHQIGIENIGGTSSHFTDAENIAIGHHVLKELNVMGNVRLLLNTLGDSESRDAYRVALVDYFTKYERDLSDDSRERLKKNPLRILDSKDETDREIIVDAPVNTDYLTRDSLQFFDNVKNGLELFGVDYTLAPRLVRGLDYYCHTTFEFVTDALGAQGAVLAGGRYDGLMENQAGVPTFGSGWAAGVERLAMLLPETLPGRRPIAVIPVSIEAEEVAPAMGFVEGLRLKGWYAELMPTGNLKKAMKMADSFNAAYAIIMGENEVKSGKATVRNMDTGDQTEVEFDKLEEFFVKHYS